jgi:hypothetical protein
MNPQRMSQPFACVSPLPALSRDLPDRAPQDPALTRSLVPRS